MLLRKQRSSLLIVGTTRALIWQNLMIRAAVIESFNKKSGVCFFNWYVDFPFIDSLTVHHHQSVSTLPRRDSSSTNLTNNEWLDILTIITTVVLTSQHPPEDQFWEIILSIFTFSRGKNVMLTKVVPYDARSLKK